MIEIIIVRSSKQKRSNIIQALAGEEHDMAKQKKYTKAVVPSLEEALGISDDLKEQVGAEIADSYGIEAFVDSHRVLEEILQETDRHVDEYVAAYEKDQKDREPVEKVYALKIGTLMKMAKRFHPLSTYGIGKLDAAVKCRMEFEALIGPMITRITKNNIDLFKTVLSKDTAEDILSGRLSAIGAVRTKKGTAYGVGALAYYFDELQTERVGRINWLFVNKEFRERGVADHLIGELTDSMVKAGVFHLSAEFPTTCTEKNILGYLFGSWHFDLDTGLDPDAVMRAGDVTGYTKIESLKKGVMSLSELGIKESDLLVKKTLRMCGYHGYLKDQGLSEDYIDRDLSCFVGDKNAAKAILLAHKTASGAVRAEYLGFAPKCEALIYNLVSFFLGKAVTLYEDDTLVKLPVDMEELGDFLEELCPKQMGQYLVAGNMTKPDPETDLTPEEIDQFMKQ